MGSQPVVRFDLGLRSANRPSGHCKASNAPRPKCGGILPMSNVEPQSNSAGLLVRDFAELTIAGPPGSTGTTAEVWFGLAAGVATAGTAETAPNPDEEASSTMIETSIATSSIKSNGVGFNSTTTDTPAACASTDRVIASRFHAAPVRSASQAPTSIIGASRADRAPVVGSISTAAAVRC